MRGGGAWEGRAHVGRGSTRTVEEDRIVNLAGPEREQKREAGRGQGKAPSDRLETVDWQVGQEHRAEVVVALKSFSLTHRSIFLAVPAVRRPMTWVFTI